MPKLDIANLRQRLRVRDNMGYCDGENGIPHGHAARKLMIGCELDQHYGMTCKLSLGYGQRIPSVTLDINPATALFLEMGKALGVDVVALVELLATKELKETANEN